jgi:NAD(P)-dependent dehydrogenase (short-subunit alcohol dehydrogenase family)
VPQKILDTNLYGVINGLNTFVPDFQKRGEGEKPSAIVITGSKQGITNPPGNAAYNASKAAVKALAEHLSFDLKDTKTSVHLLVPGWTFTGLVRSRPIHISPPLHSSRKLLFGRVADERRVEIHQDRRKRSQMVHGVPSKSRTSWCTK